MVNFEVDNKKFHEIEKYATGQRYKTNRGFTRGRLKQ